VLVKLFSPPRVSALLCVFFLFALTPSRATFVQYILNLLCVCLRINFISQVFSFSPRYYIFGVFLRSHSLSLCLSHIYVLPRKLNWFCTAWRHLFFLYIILIISNRAIYKSPQPALFFFFLKKQSHNALPRAPR